MLLDKLKAVFRLLRVNHYIKNLFVFIPLFFSHKFFEAESFLNALAMFISFCAISSVVYIINDIVDKEEDAKHPVKCNRPIASGKVSVNLALAIGFICLLTSMVIFYSGGGGGVVLLLYLLLNLLYSFKLKKFPIIDVACIALGFVFRIIGGSIAIDVELSGWMALTITMMSFFLGFGKRRNEMLMVEDYSSTRKSLNNYSINYLDKVMSSALTLTIVFYSLWCLDTDTYLLLTVPLVLIGAYKYMLIIESDTHADPTTLLMKDHFIQLCVLLCASIIFYIIYLK